MLVDRATRGPSCSGVMSHLYPARGEVIRRVLASGSTKNMVYSKGDEPAFGVLTEAEVGLTCGLCHRSLASSSGWAEFTFPICAAAIARKGRIRLGLGAGWAAGWFTNRNYRHGYCPNKVLFGGVLLLRSGRGGHERQALPPLLVEGCQPVAGPKPEAPGVDNRRLLASAEPEDVFDCAGYWANILSSST